ncbi:hypothetical protein HELRODRAFT_78375 [Helobdella robusta]|uniref:Rab5-interacting protein n=1 Tax=Helobdella robusta TaxID=6412 RepID=T1G3B1_HELRO|nr:hypothetical protein HELRODRAFT_78375 [Helobdella robusta]ESO05025.1 hypothetical protein HELRODRAFT_78375 [Helobdella robusta]
MATNNRKKPSEKSTNDCSIKSTLIKAFKSNSDWPDKDEFLDVIYWIRQVVGLLLGIVWGIFPLKGFIGIILFLAVNIALIYFYVNTIQKVDEDDYGGTSEIIKEGLMTSFATFVVTWIIVYSALHQD